MQETLEKVDLHCRRLRGNGLVAQQEWVRFHYANRFLKSSNSASYVDGLNFDAAFEVANQIARSSALHTVLALSRILDSGGSDRMTLVGVSSLVMSHQDAFKARAMGWATWSLYSDSREYLSQLKEFSTRVSELKSCKEHNRVRSLRNQSLAHILNTTPDLPQYRDVGILLGRVMCALTVMAPIDGVNFDPREWLRIRCKENRRFWNIVADGLAQRD